MKYSYSLLVCISLLVLSAAAPSALSQTLDPYTTGRHYVLAYPDTTTNAFDGRFPNSMADTILVMIYSAVDNQISIVGNGYAKDLEAKAGKFTLLYLDDSRNRASAPIVWQSGVVNRNVFRLEAEQPVIIYCYIMTKFGGEAWTPLPVESWGEEYFAASFPGEVPADVSPGGETDYRSRNKMAPAQITIVSAFDSTEVTIEPADSLLGRPATTVYLSANEVYQVQSLVDTIQSHAGEPQSDIAGTRITANKPIGVLSGNTRAQLNPNETQGLARNSFKNMAIEWLAPIRQHGHEFVFMPAWDDLRILGTPNEKIEDKRPGELVRIYRTRPGKTQGTRIIGGATGRFTVDEYPSKPAPPESRFFLDRRGSPVAAVYRTDSAAQAFMAPLSTVKWNGTTGGGTFVGASANSWGTYMVEMVPREQWPSFAPYYTPLHPAQMNHHVNIVTDTASRLKIYREDGTRVVFGNSVIPGTDLVWGHIALAPGIDRYFVGRDGARFFAYAYGFWRGYELYRPGKVGKRDEPDLASGGRGGEGLLHPSEYEENTAVAYGYPLAPRRLVLGRSDSLRIETTPGCHEMRIDISTVNANAAGIRSIDIDLDSGTVALVPIFPSKPLEYIGRSSATVKILQTDLSRGAGGRVIITDRTGKVREVTFGFQVERASLAPALVDFGPVEGLVAKDTVVTVTNPMTTSITVTGLALAQGTQGVGVIGSTPSLPADLAPGASMQIRLRFAPSVENSLYYDTLIVRLTCDEIRLPLSGETVKPCVYVEDLGFGSGRVGDTTRIKLLDICNQGRGSISFVNPNGGNVVEWDSSTGFSIQKSMLDSLKSATLGPNECIQIAVSFRPKMVGEFKAVVKFWTSVDCDRDTSVWSVKVTDSTTLGVESGATTAGTALTAITPNPLSERTEIRFNLENRTHARIRIVDAAGVEVALLVDGPMKPGEHRLEWDASGYAAGTYFCRLECGSIHHTLPLVIVK